MIMQNIDIIILSSIVTVLFLVFLYVVIGELSKPEEDYTFTEDSGPRTVMIKKVGSIFDTVDQSQLKKKRKPKQNSLKTT